MTTSLDLSLCKARQGRLCVALAAQNLDAALITDPRHVFYLTGYWRVGRPVFISALLLRADGRSLLVAPLPPDSSVAADAVEVFESNRIGTLVDDQPEAVMKVLRPRCEGIHHIGRDQPGPLWQPDHWIAADLAPTLRSMRRAKDPDEVALLQVAIAAAEAGYAWAIENAVPGMSEVAIYAGIAAAATRSAGEPIVELGNDFQCGALGGPPRNRNIERGEAFVLDIAVGVRGYASDLCRTFIIDSPPTPQQQDAHTLVMHALAHIEARAASGVSCKALHEETARLLANPHGWVFPHHTGHGIGLSAHEAPRLNPHWDDTLKPGDVFTAEPGLYGQPLRSGVRVEEDYLIRHDGSLQKLSSFNTALRVS